VELEEVVVVLVVIKEVVVDMLEDV